MDLRRAAIAMGWAVIGCSTLPGCLWVPATAGAVVAATSSSSKSGDKPVIPPAALKEPFIPLEGNPCPSCWEGL